MHDVQTMLQSALEAVKQKFLDKIKAGGIAITEEQLEDLRSVFSGPSSNPFQGLETKYKHKAFFKENLKIAQYSINKTEYLSPLVPREFVYIVSINSVQ